MIESIKSREIKTINFKFQKLDTTLEVRSNDDTN